MRDMQPKAGGRGTNLFTGVFVALLVASFLLFLPGCRGPLAPAAEPDAGVETGTLELTLERQGVRTIFPDQYFYHHALYFYDYADRDILVHDVSLWIPGQLVDGLPVGQPLYLRVYSYAHLDGSFHRVAEGSSPGFEILPVGRTNVTVRTFPILREGPGYYGRFTWGVGFDDIDGYFSVFVYTLENWLGGLGYKDYRTEWIYRDNWLWGPEFILPSGQYVVRFVAERYDSGEQFELIEALHIYQGMTSHFNGQLIDQTHFPSDLLEIMAQAWWPGRPEGPGFHPPLGNIQREHFTEILRIGIAAEVSLNTLLWRFAHLLDGRPFPDNLPDLRVLVDASMVDELRQYGRLQTVGNQGLRGQIMTAVYARVLNNSIVDFEWDPIWGSPNFSLGLTVTIGPNPACGYYYVYPDSCECVYAVGFGFSVPAAPLEREPGTVLRNVPEILIGSDQPGDISGLIAGGHFAYVNLAAGTAWMFDMGRYVRANAPNNSSGMQVLPAGLTQLRPHDVLRVTGRTTGAFGSSRMELAHIGAGVGAGLGDEAIHSGGIPTSFTFDRSLTAADIANGLRVAPNSWGAPGIPSYFAFSIDDLIVFRPDFGYQVIRFNLADPGGAFQALSPGDPVATTGLSPFNATAAVRSATYGGFTDRNYLYISGRTANYHGLNVTGVNAGDTVRVTGRRGANWPGDVVGNIQLQDGGSGATPAPGAPGSTFTITGTATASTFRIAVNAWGGTGTEAERAANLSFYIYSIIVGQYLFMQAADPNDTVDYEHYEDFWPAPPVPIDTTALSAAIGAASQMLGTTLESTNGLDIRVDRYWATPMNIHVFTNARNAAQGALEALESQAAIDAALGDLGVAQAEFVGQRLPGLLSVDVYYARLALQVVISRVEGLNYVYFTDASWQALYDALVDARGAMTSTDASAINAARVALEDAEYNLVLDLPVGEAVVNVTFANLVNPLGGPIHDAGTINLDNGAETITITDVPPGTTITGWYRGGHRLSATATLTLDEGFIGPNLLTVRANTGGRMHSLTVRFVVTDN